MILLLNILLITALSYWGWRTNNKSTLAGFYWPGLILKILSGFLVGVLYRYFLGFGDTWAMFSSALEMKNVAFSSWDHFIDIIFLNNYESLPDFQYSWFPTAYFIKLLAVLAIITGSNYWIASIYLSLLAYFGLWALSNSIYRQTKSVLVAVLLTLFFPSIVFWSSGVLKDTITMAALSWSLAIILDYVNIRHITKSKFGILFLCVLVLAIIKYYFAAALVISLLAGLGYLRTSLTNQKWWIELGLFMVLFVAIGVALSFLHPNLWLNRILIVIVNNYEHYKLISSSDNMLVFDGLSANIWSFISYLPKALFGGLYLPLWGGDNFFRWLMVIENWVIMGGTIWACVKFRFPQNREDRAIMFAALAYILLMASLIAFSAPNFGTLIRYKIGYLIVFLPLLLTSIVQPSSNRA